MRNVGSDRDTAKDLGGVDHEAPVLDRRGDDVHAAWRDALPKPLTPLLMRGSPLDRAARRRAGQPDKFLDELEAWQPATPGS